MSFYKKFYIAILVATLFSMLPIILYGAVHVYYFGLYDEKFGREGSFYLYVLISGYFGAITAITFSLCSFIMKSQFKKLVKWKYFSAAMGFFCLVPPYLGTLDLAKRFGLKYMSYHGVNDVIFVQFLTAILIYMLGIIAFQKFETAC